MNPNTIIWFLFFGLVLDSNTYGQGNTIGLLEINEDLVSEGYVLFSPENQSSVFLIDNCGRKVHEWNSETLKFPGKEQYLSEDGQLYRATIQPDLHGSTFGTGGAGGVLEIVNWDGSTDWQYVIADTVQRQHHDIHIMPNGNFLCIAWENIPLDTAAAHGFDTLNNSQIGFWTDNIIEIDPRTDSVVWKWRSFNHMIQDFDSTKFNYGEVSEHPERININYVDFVFGRQDVHHMNSLDYNEELDMIMVSVRNFNEVWIIDHSTTTQEAAGSEGGIRNRGGDLLYRWGNPSAYDMGDINDQKLFRQHDAAWIDDVPDDHPYYGKVSVYNNFIDNEFSLGTVFEPVFNQGNGTFEQEEGLYLPIDITTTFSHPELEKTFSSAASNIQMLPNGNVLMCASRQGRLFEITNDGKLVWEYLVPMRNGFPINQGDEILLSQNFTFSGRRYAPDFKGFEGKDLEPKDFIELQPNEDFCISPVNTKELLNKSLKIFPNPALNQLKIKVESKSQWVIYNVTGEVVESLMLSSGTNQIDISFLPPGIYFLKNLSTQEIIKFIKL